MASVANSPVIPCHAADEESPGEERRTIQKKSAAGGSMSVIQRSERDYEGVQVLTFYGMDDRGWPFADARIMQNGIELHKTEQLRLDPVILEGRNEQEVLDDLADEVDRIANEWIDRYVLAK